jgi:hypothetical protein
VRRGAVSAAFSTGLLLLAGAATAAPSPSGLLYSTASDSVVEPQPPAGSCHAIGSGLYSRPDPRCTPGTLNPQVTQATIGRTICRSGWTSTIRPPESITEPEKFASMRAYDHEDCKKGRLEELITGGVKTASTTGTGIPALGETFTATICKDPKTHKVSLLEGTYVEL